MSGCRETYTWENSRKKSILWTFCRQGCLINKYHLIQGPSCKCREFLKLTFIYCLSILSTCVSAHNMCVWCLGRPEVDTKSPGTWVADGCELSWWGTGRDPEIWTGSSERAASPFVCYATSPALPLSFKGLCWHLCPSYPSVHSPIRGPQP